MQAADSGPDLIVGVRGDVFHQEVDKPRVALEDTQDLQGSVGRVHDSRRRRSGGPRSRAPRESHGGGDVVRNESLEQDREKTTEGEYQAFQAKSPVFQNTLGTYSACRECDLATRVERGQDGAYSRQARTGVASSLRRISL